MRSWSLGKFLLLLPAAALLTIVLGCGKGDNNSAPPGTEESGGGGAGASGGGGKEELASTGWGTVKGRVTLDGPAPDESAANQKLKEEMEKNGDHATCLAAPEDQKTQQAWMIGKDNGVANVVVWLRPPEGKFFKVDMDEKGKEWPDKVSIDQPHCMFVPHVVTLFPEYIDPKTKKKKETGQEFVILNSAPVNHNTNIKGGSKNNQKNEIIKPGGSMTYPDHPDTTPISISCNIHQWMNAYAWSFDHPYAAVTDKDGNYEIKHVPAGVDLQIVAWHEPDQYINGNKGEKIKFEDGKDTTKDFKLKAK